MEAVPLVIACGPLALYLLFLGIINLRRRPTVLSGQFDIAALAAAISGLVMIGPMNLFMPEAAAIRFGPLVWPLLLSFYGLCVLLYMLVSRPRLVIFNLRLDQLRPVLEQVVRHMDSDARLAGDAVQLPQLTVQFHLDSTPAMRSVSLIGTGDFQSHTGWKRLQRDLIGALRPMEVGRNPRGFTFVTIGLLLIAWPAFQLWQLPGNEVAQKLIEILRW